MRSVLDCPVVGVFLAMPRCYGVDIICIAIHKELRFGAANGVWRVAFAFDTEPKAVLLIAGDKSGGNEKRFYRELIRNADDRFDAHLARLNKEGK